MKVYLPSKGIFGCSVIEMRIPSFADLHYMQSYNQEELLQRYKFVELLCPSLDLRKVTFQDIDYLFLISSFSLLYNQAKYTLICPRCGKEFSSSVNLVEQGVKVLSLSKGDLPYVCRLGKDIYSFRLLSAYDYMRAYDEAQYSEDSVRAFSDIRASMILGKSLEEVLLLPTSIYLSALLFERLHYHGLDMLSKGECVHCGEVVPFRFGLSSEVLRFDVDKLMSRFVNVSDYITLNDFMRMSVIDFNSFVKYLNKRLKLENS